MKKYQILLLAITRTAYSWQHWDYTNTSYATEYWKGIWGKENGPSSRQGHTMVLWNESIVVLFGGRDNDIHRPHIPKTYDLVEEDGELRFDTYTEKPLLDYNPTNCQPVTECFPLTNASSGNTESCSYSWHHEMDSVQDEKERLLVEEQCGFTVTSLLFNDIWIYDLNCERYEDLPCEKNGWRVLDPGKRYGGCRNDKEGNRICDVPSERWNHGAAMIDSTTMIIYGGYSQECQDYCDDVWSFDFESLTWERIFQHAEPGKRWRFSMLSLENVDSRSMIAIFGGHRLWHGFAEENSQENEWNSTDNMPEGGYLNDLWTLEKIQKVSEQNATWQWKQIEAKETCFANPGPSWEERNNVRCDVLWPNKRSSHAAVFDKERNRIWIHGGKFNHYPYPSSTSSGAGVGVKELNGKGFIPYATQSYFQEDLWYYDFNTETWMEVIPRNTARPSMRMDHILLLSSDLLILHGGFANNVFFNDTWYFNITSNKWLKKNSFVHAFYPESCTDDIEYIMNTNECVELAYPKPLLLAENQSDYLPYNLQPGYTPDTSRSLYFNIVDDADLFVASLKEKYKEVGEKIWIESSAPDGTPIAPDAATGPRQYARKRQMPYNETLTLEIWEWCVSVSGEPSRGREQASIHIKQPRRQTIGWDGCRESRWVLPPSRSSHDAVFVQKHNKIVMYGGLSYLQASHWTGEHPVTGVKNFTHESLVVQDMWTYGMDLCPKHCSNVGDCRNGFCFCEPGYFGVDCSNTTCPGTTCHYDENNEQHCSHCCFDGFTHAVNDHEYVSGVSKQNCEVDLNGKTFSGRSNGICDGFGTCQCSPPFVGEDCSILDCKDDCNDNGYCSLEFPIARCICNRGYKGASCEHVECLHNCSYPNGYCDHSNGKCSCAPIYSPYNRSRIWAFWGGEDCSYALPFAGVDILNLSKVAKMLTTVIVLIYLF